MARPRARFLSRAGILSFLRRPAPHHPSGDELTKTVERAVARALKSAHAELNDEVRHLRQRQHDLVRDVRLLHAVLAANNGTASERHAEALNAHDVGCHVAAAIARAPFDECPMPHVAIEGLLPPATYAALLDGTPPDECFTDRDPIKRNFRLTPGKLVPRFTETMWTFMEQEVIPRMMVPALLERFRPAIDAVYAERYGRELGAAVSALPHEATAGRLMLRRPGYHLDPHIDPRRVIVTCLIYIAYPGDSPEFGTQLFALNESPVVDRSKTFYPGEAGYTSTLEKTVPFLPNSAMAFLNAGPAAHGADIPQSAPEHTKRYAYQFYISPDPERLKGLTGE